MKRFFFPPISLLVVFANLILAWAVVSCAGGGLSPTLEGSPTAVSSVTTGTTPATPTSSAFTSPTHVSGESAVPFQTLAQGFRLQSAQSEPTLLMAVDPTSRDALVSLIDPEHRDLLANVDLDKEVVLAAMWGAKPSGGYSITISKILISSADLTVNAILKEDDPNVPRLDASTFPYHLVTVNRLDLPKDANLHYRLVSDDTLLAEGELP